MSQVANISQQRIFKVLVAPIVSEKTAAAGESANQVVFRVLVDSTKQEIKAAVEKLFDVNVENVTTLKVKGKTKRTRFGIGKRSDWKKAYVRLAEGQDIDFAVVE